MIVIESGGTKSSWIFKLNDKQIVVESVGLHPREISDEKSIVVSTLITEHNLENQEVYFFGAGCESDEAKVVISNFLTQKGLVVKKVETDIYAACLAHLGNESGVVAIIGTGAVAAQFDRNKVTKITSGLGYILGDEGSGFDLGKRLLQSYFKGELKKEINAKIEDYFENKSILHQIYAPDGRKVIAGLTKIMLEFRHESAIQTIIHTAFVDFCNTALKPLIVKNKVHFIGSIAFFFQEELEKVLAQEGYTIGNIHHEAILPLYDYLKGI